MPWTYSTLRQAMIDWAENPETTFMANIDNMIRMAELRIAETVQVPVTRIVVNGTMTAKNPGIVLPPDFLSPYSLRGIDRGGVTFWLQNKEEEFRRTAYPDPAYYAQPEYYSLTNQGASGALAIPTAAMSPTPDYGYGYILSYFGRPSSIVDNTTSYMGTNAEDVLFFACMKNSAVFMKEEQDVVQMYDGLYQEAAYNFRVTGHGRQRKDWYRKPDRRKEVTAESTTPPVQQQAPGGD